ncbi:MAG TPA: DedA family protein [Patescibacteria group bacterium]|nr:DedA family protein [Patescibacteria group bacterium]
MLEALSGFIIHFISSTGYAGVFFLMALGTSIIPFPAEVTLPFSGFLVHSGTLNYFLVVIIAAIGDTTGSLVQYGIGYFLEENVILNLIKKHGKYILVSEREYSHAAKWFEKYGDKAVLLGKLIPGGRFIISLPAGVFKMKLWKFITYTFTGALIWAALLTYLGVYLGNKWQSIGGYFKQFEYVVIVLLVIAVLWYLNHKLGLIKKIIKK